MWSVAVEPVESPESLTLLRDYVIEVSERYYQLHEGRSSTKTDSEEVLAASPTDDVACLLIGEYVGDAAACTGLRVLDPDTVELTRLYIRPAFRGTGGGAQLLGAVEVQARDLGAKRIVLDTRLDLVEARALYNRHGYTEIPA